MRLMLPVRKQTKVDCEATSIAASEWESEITTGGPQEEEEFEFELWDFTRRSKPQKGSIVSLSPPRLLVTAR
jgi:hypothetical protein